MMMGPQELHSSGSETARGDSKNLTRAGYTGRQDEKPPTSQVVAQWVARRGVPKNIRRKGTSNREELELKIFEQRFIKYLKACLCVHLRVCVCIVRVFRCLLEMYNMLPCSAMVPLALVRVYSSNATLV